MTSQTDIRSPLAVAKGWGSAKSGTGHFITQRVTAIANIPLTLWTIYHVVGFVSRGSGIEEVQSWMAQPINAVLLVLFLVNAFYHMSLGLQIVIEDYVHKPFSKYISLLLVRFAGFFFVVLGIVSIFKVTFGG